MPSVGEQLKEVRKQLAQCHRELREAKSFNEQLRAALGEAELHGWQPAEHIQRQYGWVFAWSHPLYQYLEENLGKQLTPDMRNRAVNIFTAIIAQLVGAGRYGVKLPFEPRDVDLDAFMAKQRRSQNLRYEPCAICGETRITHDCHVIPQTEGGPSHLDNLITLCPLHHHLFDHDRLLPEEWDVVMGAVDAKMDAAIIYAREVRLLRLQGFWQRSEDASGTAGTAD